mmetsp:Transcript_20695/g.43486  ORF Transcript_20695/g.43486 Transcript_20695/m.43486 type:complete len:751 (+) Transcript_20695:163-2415(+)|eukprot:CAMPEP_0171446288 /NCGR_PEP_ID=MMETSP0881-20121228/38065_1 /TAXON_ID=67004 /ORGANISM="Thalassiosira weissflogii, Strain CCMP1336" /LENGTH=750 /DNA_ID=CAMNT_0011970589 /DNA_START=151 /DNA_END=2403 /DNA_ORIENTATION=+
MRRSLDVWKRRRKKPSFDVRRRRVLLSDGQDDLSLSVGDVSSVIDESDEYEHDYDKASSSSYSVPDSTPCSSSCSEDMKFQSDVIPNLSGSVNESNRTPLDAPGWVDSTGRKSESRPGMTNFPQRVRSPDWCPQNHEAVDPMAYEVLPHSKDNTQTEPRLRHSPPPNFSSSSEEVRIAIKHHRQLGRGLSLSALDKEINSIRSSHGIFPSNVDCQKQNKDVARTSAPSGSSTCASTLESTFIGSSNFSESSNHLSFLMRNPKLMRKHGDEQSTNPRWQTATVDNDKSSCHTERTSICDRIPPPGNSCLDPDTGSSNRKLKRQSVGTYSCCSSISSRSRLNRRKIERHVTFLEAHMEKHCSLEACVEEYNFWPCEPAGCSDNLSTVMDTISIDRLSKDDLFFPRDDDLKSPLGKGPSARTDSTQLTSPPNTPSSCASQLTKSIELTYSQSPLSHEASVKYRRDDLECENVEKSAITIDGKALVNDMERIKQETAAMMDEMQQKMKSNLKHMMERETERHCSKIKSALSEVTKQYPPLHNKENEEPSPSPQSSSRKLAQLMSPRAKSSGAYPSGSPRSQRRESLTDQNELLKRLETSLGAMETKILLTISKQMEKEASHQRQVLEDIIEEKVTRVIAGTNLEMQLALQEVKRENERLSRKALSRMSMSGGNDFMSPVRFPTPKRTDNCRRRSPGSFTPRRVVEESVENGLEDSFAQTMKVIDDFVLDCDDIVNDLDKIAFRMQDDDADEDAD